MKRLIGIAGLISLSTGCLSLDFMFLDNPQVKAYDFDPKEIPEENIEVVQFDRGDGTMLGGVWLKQDPDLLSPPMIFFHGNSGNVEDNFDRLEWYWSWGEYDVFAPDYSGWGISEGEASWENLRNKDGVAAIDHVYDKTGIVSEDVPMIALSLGGFVAIHAVDERPAQALILQSVFANSDLLLDTSLKMDVPPGWFFAADWENDVAIRELGGTPTFIIHGLADDFIDPESGRSCTRTRRATRNCGSPRA